MKSGTFSLGINFLWIPCQGPLRLRLLTPSFILTTTPEISPTAIPTVTESGQKDDKETDPGSGGENGGGDDGGQGG